MTLTADQLLAMKSGEAIRMKLADDETEVVVIRADVFDALREVSDDEFHASDAYKAFCDVASPAGCDDPEMDEYDSVGVGS